MAYFILSPDGEESLNIFLSPDPDPDRLRGGPSHGHNTSCVNKSSQLDRSFLSHASGQTYRHAFPGTALWE